MDQLRRLLAQHFNDVHWGISTPAAGSQKETYVARSECRTVFLKFDVDARPWQRLATIGATPPLLASGMDRGRPYLIQTFVDGRHPDRRWLAMHHVQLARFVKAYHSDRPLTTLLASMRPPRPFAEHIDAECATLAAGLANARLDAFTTARTHQAFGHFTVQAAHVRPVPLVPIHADPSPVNMLVTTDRLTMVDWDDVMLSDPMRDLGLIAWWYLPHSVWPQLFDAYDTVLDETRIYWWVARRSLELALWLEQRHDDEVAQEFLDDFYRAVQHQANPQATNQVL